MTAWTVFWWVVAGVLGFTVASILAIFAGTFALAALIRIIDRWHL